MRKRIDWWEVLDVFCWGLDKIAHPTLSKLLSSYEGDLYRAYGPRLWRRLEQESLLQRTGRGPKAKFAITPKGRERCAETDPTTRWNQSWDKRWRLVTFDIPENQRKDRLSLRRELREHRLGLLQRSVWVSAHDIESVLLQIVKARGIPECFAVFECNRLILCSSEEVVRTAWDFDMIGKAQDVYLSEAKSFLNDIRAARGLAVLARVAREERLQYTNAMNADPFLPRQLWPPAYRGEKVYGVHSQFRAELTRRFGSLVESVE